jgi:hypothetical protein
MIFEEDSDESKKVVIVINLVEESLEKANEEIEKEILEELTDDMPIIPWLERVERVTVIEE